MIFAEPGTAVSDKLVPPAVRLIEDHDDLRLLRFVDVLEGSGPPYDTSFDTSFGAYVRARLRRAVAARQLGIDLLCPLHARRYIRTVPFPAQLGLPSCSDVELISPPDDNVNHPGFVAEVNELAPDAILLPGCGQVLEEPLRSIPDRGVVNYHWSYLPEYRGRYATFWPPYFGEDWSGTTFHLVDKRRDRGQLVTQTSVPVRAGYPTLKADCLVAGVELLPDVVERIATDDLDGG